MSGMFPRITNKSGYKDPHIDKRPELEKTNPDIPNVLPERIEMRVIASVNSDLKPLARVSKKFQVAGQPTLSFEVDDYTADTLVENFPPTSDRAKEILQCCLHEMMHMALWDDVTISHNPDKTSLLYYYVDGSVLTPNAWDLQAIKDAAKRIGSIRIEMRSLRSHNIDYYMRIASGLWNEWIGREFYKLI